MTCDACIHGFTSAVPSAISSHLASALQQAFYKPVRNILQSWRLSLASLLFFTLFLTDNFGLSSIISSSVHDHPSQLDFHQNSEFSSSSPWSLSEFFISQIVNLTNPDMLSPTCLVSYNLSRDICEKKVGDRSIEMRSLSLVFCGSGYPIYHLIDDSCKIHGSESECKECFKSIEQLDKDVHDMNCHFERLLNQADCSNNYSTHWKCEDCKVR